MRSYEQMGRAYESVNECAFQPLGETVPLFVIGGYDGLDEPSVNISYVPDHKAGRPGLCAGGAASGSIRDRVVWYC